MRIYVYKFQRVLAGHRCLDLNTQSIFIIGTFSLSRCLFCFVHRLFDWRPERMRGEPLKCERVVVIKNLFAPEDFDKDVQLLLEYQQDIRSECLKCGDVRKVVVYDVSLPLVSSSFSCMRDYINANASTCVSLDLWLTVENPFDIEG